MVRLKPEETEDLNVAELDAIEYSTETFDSYDGEVPPKDIELLGYVRKMWWTRTQNGDPMLKILWLAAENTDDLEEYNGCPFWLNYALIGGAKFRWAPFLDNFGITLKDVKTKTDVADKDDQNGAPINKIARFRPGEEFDEAWSYIITDRERYNGEWKPAVKSWLTLDEAEEDADEAEPEDEEDYEEEEAEEPEPEPERPTRGRGRAPARSAPDKPAPARGARGTRSAPAKPEQPAPRGARGARSAKPAAAPAKAPARGARSAPARGRGRDGGYDEEPPF